MLSVQIDDVDGHNPTPLLTYFFLNSVEKPVEIFLTPTLSQYKTKFVDGKNFKIKIGGVGETVLKSSLVPTTKHKSYGGFTTREATLAEFYEWHEMCCLLNDSSHDFVDFRKDKDSEKKHGFYIDYDLESSRVIFSSVSRFGGEKNTEQEIEGKFFNYSEEQPLELKIPEVVFPLISEAIAKFHKTLDGKWLDTAWNLKRKYVSGNAQKVDLTYAEARQGYKGGIVTKDGVFAVCPIL